MKKLSNEYISELTLEIAHLLKAGITVQDGFDILAEGADLDEEKKMLETISAEMEEGKEFAEALKNQGCFPDYMISMIEVGDRSGRLEDTLTSLSNYYDNRERIQKTLISAVSYPTIMFILMFGVVLILLTKVLPVFEGVYAQLGTGMTGFAAVLMKISSFVSVLMPVILIILLILAVCAGAFAWSDGFRNKAIKKASGIGGKKGTGRKTAERDFAAAAATMLKSGLNTEEAIEMAINVCPDNQAVTDAGRKCLEMLEEGTDLGTAASNAALFPGKYCRMLKTGVRSGTTDEIMEEIAERMTADAENAINKVVGRIEPVMVIVSSCLMGIILLGALIPLINVISALG